MKRTILLAAVLTLFVIGAAWAGHIIPPAGYTLSEVSVKGWWANGFDYAPNGTDFIVYDESLYQLSPDGTVQKTLYTLPAGVYGSFVRVDSTAGRVYFGESSNGTISWIDLSDPSNTVHTFASLAGNYDFEFRNSSEAYVVAGSDIYVLNLGTGNSIKLASLGGGVSGAIAVDGTGNLYYGTAAAWAGSGQSLVKWTASQVDLALMNGTVLSLADGILLAQNIGSVGGLAVAGSELYMTTSIVSPARVLNYNSLDAGGVLSDFALASNNWEWFSGLRYNAATGAISINAGTAIITLTPVPEPTALVGLGFVIIGVAARRRIRR